MDLRDVARFLAKAVLFLLALLLVWELTPAGRYYSSVLAVTARHVYASPRSDRVIHDIRVRADELVLNVSIGKARENLLIAARDITNNLCVLLALYVASPILRWRLFLAFLGAALIVLFGVHLASLYVIARVAIAWREGADAAHSGGIVDDMGPWMYPLILLLWAPYLLVYYRKVTR